MGVNSVLNQYTNSIMSLIIELEKLYEHFDNSLIIDNNKINLANTNLANYSFDYDKDNYFLFMQELYDYQNKLAVSTLRNDFASVATNYKFEITYRIKNTNSISDKFDNYVFRKKEGGHSPIYKCFNDIFGARATLDYSFFDKLLNSLEDNMGKLESNFKHKVIKSTKQRYNAIHIYISKDNYTFPWELQIWLKKDSKSNKKSHRKHKQQYTTWENDLQEQNIIDLFA